MSNKEISVEFLSLCAGGRAAEAFNLYTSSDMKHHNIYFKGDPQSLLKAIDEDARANPGKTFEPKHVIEETDMVVVHSHVRQNPKHRGYALIHLLRFEKGKIVELWDIGQEIPDNNINENGAF